MPVLTTKTDQEIQQDVFRELRWDSRVDQTEIGVEVDNGIVTLTGTLDRSFGEFRTSRSSRRPRRIAPI